MPFDNRLTGGRTPSRLLALCKLLERQPFSRDELRNLLQPPKLNTKNEAAFDEVFSLASRGELIKIDQDELVTLAFNKKHLEDTVKFRRFIADRLMQNSERLFVRFSCWYMEQGRIVYRLNDKELISSFIKDLGDNFNITKIYGWRQWFTYLGYGYQHGGKLIPNVANRLSDVLLDDEREVPRHKRIRFTEFMGWLNQRCPELDTGDYAVNFAGSAKIEPRNLSIGLSAGLRALHDKGTIKLVRIRDASDVWRLHSVSTHEISDTISDIEIGG